MQPSPRGKSSAPSQGESPRPSTERAYYIKTAALESSATVHFTNGKDGKQNSAHRIIKRDNSNRNTVFVYRVAWEINSLVPDHTCSA